MKPVSTPRSDDRHAAMLRGRDLKATSGRIAVLQSLERAKKPLSADAIHAALPSSLAIDPATTYRILNSLVERGMVRRVDFQHSHAHFELWPDRDHHHLICTSCGAVEDVLECDVEEMQKRALAGSRQFASVDRHSLEFFGICRKCARK